MGWKALLAVLGSVFLIAACSGSSDTSPADGAGAEAGSSTDAAAASSETSSTPSSATGSSTTGQETGGKLVRLYIDPPTLDPHLTT